MSRLSFHYKFKGELSTTQPQQIIFWPQHSHRICIRRKYALGFRLMEQVYNHYIFSQYYLLVHGGGTPCTRLMYQLFPAFLISQIEITGFWEDFALTTWIILTTGVWQLLHITWVKDTKLKVTLGGKNIWAYFNFMVLQLLLEHTMFHKGLNPMGYKCKAELTNTIS